ncbi:hypothetical protein NC652_034198 [Populus alba x Populus x berolinensis]|nr:hypothetical protein NC652_034198 [Populus alba x Populus x berolinensis]
MVVVQADSLSEENVVDHLIDKQKHAAAPVKSAVNKFQLLPEFLKTKVLAHFDTSSYSNNREVIDTPPCSVKEETGEREIR